MAKNLAKAGIIAAVYAALTLILSPISYGAMQIRLSEGLVALCLFTPAAPWGLTIGCFIANILGPGGIIDALLGSAATLIGCLLICRYKEKPYISLLFNVISNAVIIGFELWLLSGRAGGILMLPVHMGWIFIGELFAVYIPGVPLFRYIKKHPEISGML